MKWNCELNVHVSFTKHGKVCDISLQSIDLFHDNFFAIGSPIFIYVYIYIFIQLQIMKFFLNKEEFNNLQFSFLLNYFRSGTVTFINFSPFFVYVVVSLFTNMGQERLGSLVFEGKKNQHFFHFIRDNFERAL